MLRVNKDALQLLLNYLQKQYSKQIKDFHDASSDILAE